MWLKKTEAEFYFLQPWNMGFDFIQFRIAYVIEK